MATKPTPPSEADIRALAHKLWEEDGRPEGQADTHWQRAHAALSNPAKSPARPAAKKAAAPTKTSKSK